VASQQHFRFNKTLVNYLLGTVVGFFLFIPWLFVLITHLSIAQQLTSHLSFFKLDNPFDLIAILLNHINRIFFDINLSSYNPWINKSFWNNSQISYSVIAVISSIVLILYILYFLCKGRLNIFNCFLILLGSVPSICLLLPDLIGGGIRSTAFRYQLPSYLSIQIAVAYVLGVYIFSEKYWQQKIWQFLMVGFVLAGLVSDVIFFKADTWWLQGSNQYSLATPAKYINKFQNPLLLTSNHIYNIGNLLILSHFFNENISLLIVQGDHLPLLPQEASNIFLFDYDMTNSQNLVARFNEDKTYSLKLADPLSELWQFEKNQNK